MHPLRPTLHFWLLGATRPERNSDMYLYGGVDGTRTDDFYGEEHPRSDRLSFPPFDRNIF